MDKIEIQKPACSLPKKWQHLRLNAWASVGEYLVETASVWIPKRTVHCNIANGWQFQSVTTHIQHFQRQQQEAWTFKKSEGNLPLPKHIKEKKSFSTKPYWQKTFVSLATVCAKGSGSNLLVLAPRKSEEDDINIETNNWQYKRKRVDYVTSSKRLDATQLTANHEMLIHEAFEQATCARTVVNGQFYITN